MENYTGCIGLHIDLLESDVTVYLDEILAYDNFNYATIEMEEQQVLGYLTIMSLFPKRQTMVGGMV